MEDNLDASFLICTNICDINTIIAIDSCLNQVTSFTFEVVIVVNGEKTSEICTKLSILFGENIKIVSSTLRGLPANLNYGINSCSGEYILRFDSDDVCLQERTERQIGFMKAHLDVGLSYGDAKVIDEKGKIIGEYISARSDSAWFLVFSNYVMHPSVCFKKEIVQNVLGYRKKFASEDYDLWLRLYFIKKIKFSRIKKELIQYRSYSDNGYRKNPKAYMTAFFFKIEIMFLSRSIVLIFGAFFSLFLSLFYYLKSMPTIKVRKS